MSRGIMAGKAVFITGASRGIGAATARVAHREGGDVVLHYGANSSAAQRLADELGGERVHLVGGDLSDPARTRIAWEQAVEAAGRIDVLVNNAGAWIASPLTDDGWADGWRDNLALNLQAPADLCRMRSSIFAPTVVGRSSTSPAVRRTAATTPSTWPVVRQRAGCWR